MSNPDEYVPMMPWERVCDDDHVYDGRAHVDCPFCEGQRLVADGWPARIAYADAYEDL